MCQFLNESNAMDEYAADMIDANERMGKALNYIYRNYPAIKEEVLTYMATQKNDF
jgi:hypothetical protein